MAKGTVKWFNTEKGYGFIQPADGGKDIFVHITAVQAAGLQTLKDDQPIEYELIDGRDGRKSAGDLKICSRRRPAGATMAAGRRVRARRGLFRRPSWSRSALARTSSTAPGFELAQLERPVGDADQAVHRQPDRLHRAADLAVAAFAERERQPGVRALLAVERHRHRLEALAVDGDAPAQRLERRVARARRGRAPGTCAASRSRAAPAAASSRRRW